MTDTKRESGYYWVELFGEWTATEWNAQHGNWFLVGIEGPRRDEDFSKIGPRIPSPDEAPAEPTERPKDLRDEIALVFLEKQPARLFGFGGDTLERAYKFADVAMRERG